VQGYIPTAPKKDCDEFCSSAGLFKNGTGKIKSTKLFYDTGSTDPWASQKFADTHGLTVRDILPDDLKVYNTVHGDIIPTKYVEIDIRDDERGVTTFTKVSFNLTPFMDGVGVLLGRIFMNKHGIKLDAKQARGMYVATGRKASDEAKAKQKRVVQDAARDAQRARDIVASSSASTTGTGTATTATSQAIDAAPSSRTNISSSDKSNHGR